MVYVTGDMHGDLARFESPALSRLKKDDTLIICGDFGFLWDGSREEAKILKRLGKKKYNICFIDGTHENFELLNAYPVTEWNGGKVHHIEGNIYHLMRGQIFRLDNLTFFTMGGGESPDIDIRFEENAWSRFEFPSREELLEGAENLEKINCRVDYIITHEPPVKIKSFLSLKDSETASVTGLNTYLEEMSAICQFRRWFFGSMHLDKFISNSHIAVYRNVINAITGEVAR
ncbi:MAG: metallophosphoesterase [Clostridia bacterium]|nr:metallophosphoesterase [Clostridia bacterium]MBR4728385.1 metallophosphoesterase [Clostridia bacterium]